MLVLGCDPTMQVLRVLHHKCKIRLTNYAASNMASICAAQLRDHSTGSLAEGTIPAALDLPSAHTSRGTAPSHRGSNKLPSMQHFTALVNGLVCPKATKIAFPSSVITAVCRCLYRGSGPHTLWSLSRILSTTVRHTSWVTGHQRYR